MVELRKARTTDTPECESTICCLGVSGWLHEMVAVKNGGCKKWMLYENTIFHLQVTFSGLLGFDFAQHRQTLRPSVDGIRSKVLRPFGSQ